MYFSLPDWSPLPPRVTDGLGFRSLYIAKHLYTHKMDCLSQKGISCGIFTSLPHIFCIRCTYN